MTDYSQADVQANGITIHYYRTGDKNKRPVLLLHGITDNGLCWPRAAQELGKDYDVIMPDARGHGRSTTTADFSLADMDDDVAALIRALKLDKPYVWGHSMGALTAAAFAAHHPHLVRAVVLEDPPLTDNPPAVQDEEQPATHGWEWLYESRALSRQERIARCRTSSPGWAEEELAPWADSKVELNIEAFEQAVQGVDRVHWRETYARIECPVLLVTADPELGAIITPELAREVVRLTGNVELERINGAGHNIHRERFDQTLEVVREFLSRT